MDKRGSSKVMDIKVLLIISASCFPETTWSSTIDLMLNDVILWSRD